MKELQGITDSNYWSWVGGCTDFTDFHGIDTDIQFNNPYQSSEKSVKSVHPPTQFQFLSRTNAMQFMCYPLLR
jgi:hypothetical protein